MQDSTLSQLELRITRQSGSERVSDLKRPELANEQMNMHIMHVWHLLELLFI